MEPTVIVLDLDGVILKSNFIKYRAMLSLFSEYADFQERISSYILSHGGVPRREKIIEIFSTILGKKIDNGILVHYLERYKAALDHELTVAPLVEGVYDFLAQRDYKFYVCSSAPETEVHDQLIRRNLLKHLSGVFGSNTPKAVALRKISESHKGKVVFFGDSIGDLEAAQQANVAFIGVINERDNFEDYNVVKLNDFSSLSIIQSCMRQLFYNQTP